MDCLKGYIGLKGCGNTTPPSGRYVNSLPGIRLKVLDNLADSEQKTYATVWDDVQERAIANMRNKVTAMFAERYRLKKILQLIDLGEEIDTINNQTSADAEYRGFTYELSFANGDSKPSSMQQFYLQTLSVYLKASGDFTVKVFDLDLKKQLYTKTVTGGTTGWNTVNIYQAFVGQRFFVCYDSTGKDSAYKAITDYTNDCCDACVSAIYGNNCTGTIRGAKSSTASAYSITQGSDTYGLSAVFSLLCSFDNVVCKSLKTFEAPYWYALGEEIMVERLASSRVNLTTIDTKEAEELRGYLGQKFQEELKLAIAGIDLDLADCCIECNAAIMYAESRM